MRTLPIIMTNLTTARRALGIGALLLMGTAGRVTAARTDADGANVGHANEGIVCGPF